MSPAPDPSKLDQTALGRLDIRAKLLVFTAFMVWTLAFSHPLVHGVICAMVLVLGRTTGLTFKQMISRLLPLLPLMALILVFTGFSPPARFIHPENQRILLQAGPFDLTRGGLLLGTTFMLRLVNMVIFTLLLLAVTPLDHVITLFARLRLSRTLSFILTTAIRFVPELDRKRGLILAAQKARGLDPESGTLFQRLRARTTVMIPLLINAILLAEQLSLALMNRGFGYRNQWTLLSDTQSRGLHRVIMALACLGIALAVYLRFARAFGKI